MCSGIRSPMAFHDLAYLGSLLYHVNRTLSDHVNGTLSVHVNRNLSDHVYRTLSDNVNRTLSDHVNRTLSDNVNRTLSDLVYRTLSDNVNRMYPVISCLQYSETCLYRHRLGLTINVVTQRLSLEAGRCFTCLYLVMVVLILNRVNISYCFLSFVMFL